MKAARNFLAGLACLGTLIGTAAPGIATAQESDAFEVAADSDTQQLLRDAESRLALGDSAGAYTLLSAREAELAGNALFDYLLGVAALDNGYLSEAIFSLRRAIAVEPGFSGARMELARAYFQAGNYGLARPLFIALLGENPPADVSDVINTYITIIDGTPTVASSRFSPFVEFIAGHDTNATGSTDMQQFLGFTLNPNNIATESAFGEIGLGFNWSIPRSGQFAWYLGGRAAARHNPDADFVDPAILSGLGGFSWQRGAGFGRLGIEGYWASLDGDPNSVYGGFDFLIGRRLGPSWELTLGARGGALRYDELIEVLDVDRLLGTAGIAYRFASTGSIRLELIGGNDSERQQGSPYGNSKVGGRLSLNAPMGQQAFLFASVGSLESDFDGLFFGMSRKDSQATAILQVEFRDVFTQGLSLVPRLRYVDNDSDITLYKYDRTEVGLMLRWAPR
jgi:tetratricopeptide (TPR) repeat protein